MSESKAKRAICLILKLLEDLAKKCGKTLDAEILQEIQDFIGCEK